MTHRMRYSRRCEKGTALPARRSRSSVQAAAERGFRYRRAARRTTLDGHRRGQRRSDSTKAEGRGDRRTSTARIQDPPRASKRNREYVSARPFRGTQKLEKRREALSKLRIRQLQDIEDRRQAEHLVNQKRAELPQRNQDPQRGLPGWD